MILDMEQLVGDYYQSLYRFALSLAGNTADACDLVQQTYYIIQTKGEGIKDPSKVKSWLFTTLRREFLQRRRHETAFPKCELDESTGELPSVSSDMVDKMDAALVWEALSRMEENFREPLTLFYLDDLSYREIAEILEIPVGTVMSRLSRAKLMLRQSLEEADRKSLAGAQIIDFESSRKKVQHG